MFMTSFWLSWNLIDVNQNVLWRCRFEKKAALAKTLLQIHEPDYWIKVALTEQDTNAVEQFFLSYQHSELCKVHPFPQNHHSIPSVS